MHSAPPTPIPAFHPDMEYDAERPEYDFSSPHAGPSSRSSGSGLKLILPPLKGGKIVKHSKSKAKRHDVLGVPDEKAARPVKLKPLKDVLTKLIAQIKKKDDYAFFLQPVNASVVPGYSDMISNPMDFGTMTIKVAKGRYRSLDDFTADFKLVTSNAMRFNPPGTIYHTEAQRIEAWGLDHIEKITPSVIQHETDWNLDAEDDDDSQQVNVDDDDDGTALGNNTPAPMDVDDVSRLGRSPSVSTQLPPGRRTLRAPILKKSTASTTTVISESLDSEGRLPGSKDGLGAFPPCSDWAETMLMLKLKGKKYKTKKERLRVEKEGPPYAPDGSLDYSQMEDPFTVLSALVPEPRSRPHLTPLYPPVSSQSIPQQYPAPTMLPFDHHETDGSVSLSTSQPKAKYKHWHLTRSSQNRSRVKDKDDPDDAAGDVPVWQASREPHALDFGSLAILSSEIANELGKRAAPPPTVDPNTATEESIVLDHVRTTLLRHSGSAITADPGSDDLHASSSAKTYFTDARAQEAEDYLRDIVYGGVDGFAYARSLAAFAAPPDIIEEAPEDTSRSDQRNAAEVLSKDSGLDMALDEWVSQHILDPLTDGRHSLLRQTALHLHNLIAGNDAPVVNMETDSDSESAQGRSLVDQVALSVHTYPLAFQALSTLRKIYAANIDLGCLIRDPSEFSQSEEEWIGNAIKARVRAQSEDVVEGPETAEILELEGPGLLNQAFNHTAELISQIDQEIRDGTWATSPLAVNGTSSAASGEEVNADKKIPLRSLRLNLLALTKRAPVNTIAPLRKDLVPKDVQDVVPTLSS